VHKGLELTAAVGLSRVTLQRLADELGVSAVAIAYYCPRSRLHVEIANLAVSDVVYPPPSEGSWDDRLRSQALQWQEVMVRYPGVQGFVATYPRHLPAVRRLVDAAVVDLTSSGLDEDAAKLLYGHYHAFFVGWNVVRSAFDDRSKDPGRHDHVDAAAGRYGWTRSERLFEFAIESHLEMIRRTRQGAWNVGGASASKAGYTLLQECGDAFGALGRVEEG
jgi:hypothetical protein